MENPGANAFGKRSRSQVGAAAPCDCQLVTYRIHRESTVHEFRQVNEILASCTVVVCKDLVVDELPSKAAKCKFVRFSKEDRHRRTHRGLL